MRLLPAANIHAARFVMKKAAVGGIRPDPWAEGDPLYLEKIEIEVVCFNRLFEYAVTVFVIGFTTFRRDREHIIMKGGQYKMISTTSSPAMDAEELSAIVCRALDLPAFHLDDWRCTSLSGHISNPATQGIYRVVGSGRYQEEAMPWSLILKVVQLAEDAPQGWGTDLLHFGYWKREALAYQSGILEDLGTNLRAPRCFEVTEQPDGSVWLWLEDISENGQAVWPVARYGLAACHFGRWQGRPLYTPSLPAASWLRTGWLHSWVAHFEFLQGYLLHPEFWDHPLVRAAFPVPVTDRLLALWAERQVWMDILDRMPLTVCHFDTWRPNLLACTDPEGQEDTVALDWQCMGLGPVGEVGNLLLTALMTLEMPVSQAKALDTAIWESYLQGLQEAGWAGDPRHVRFCYTAYPTLRWGLVFPMLMILPYVLNEEKRAEAEAKYGQPIEELLHRWAGALYFLLDLADEAHALAKGFSFEASGETAEGRR